ncbi:MAG: M3 family metallopeptidase [Cyclobacteriaceae bacterium]
MKSYHSLVAAIVLIACSPSPETKTANPFNTSLNEPVDYGSVSSQHIEAYASLTLEKAISDVSTIQELKAPTFKNTFGALDDVFNELDKARSNCHMLYWVSPDSLSRISGLSGFQKIDSVRDLMTSNKILFQQMLNFSQSDEYGSLVQKDKRFVDDLISSFEQSGVNLEPEKLVQFQKLNAEITELSAAYSTRMNTANRMLKLDESGVDGLSENFKKSYLVNEVNFEIPVMPATRGPVLNNASDTATRKAFIMEYDNRGSGGNMEILDQLIAKRREVGVLMGFDSYAGYNLKPKMAENPETVWKFLNDLVTNSKPKAIEDIKKLMRFRNQQTGVESEEDLAPWDVAYYRNQILKTQYKVDHEKIREYLPMESCLSGMMEIYQQLLGYQFKKVENASVWHEEVSLYEVYIGDELRGRFYLDLFPRPNKESWFYGVGLANGKQQANGYEVPVAMLLGNFTRPTDDLPSLLSHNELSTLFHEFGHIMDGVSYRGEFSYQANSKRDFGEAMSQIFENWIWDYEMLSSFAKHYETGETLPKETFDNMLDAKNVTSGLNAIGSLRRALYDMNIYDAYDPQNPLSTDDLWKEIDDELGVGNFTVEDTHPQASWIHINGYPVYYYGYIWSDVYAQDMFTEFEENGLLDQETGIRYRDIILSNGSQKDVVAAVEEFLGRPMNNDAYVKSLGL